ncbi:MAG: hypothetical protein K2X41_05735 [Hyphomicrobium sp.]|nr:hypothetical protein [Hyphomicrobium sp.]
MRIGDEIPQAFQIPAQLVARHAHGMRRRDGGAELVGHFFLSFAEVMKLGQHFQPVQASYSWTISQQLNSTKQKRGNSNSQKNQKRKRALQKCINELEIHFPPRAPTVAKFILTLGDGKSTRLNLISVQLDW